MQSPCVKSCQVCPSSFYARVCLSLLCILPQQMHSSSPSLSLFSPRRMDARMTGLCAAKSSWSIAHRDPQSEHRQQRTRLNLM